MDVRNYRPDDAGAIAQLFTESVWGIRATDYSAEQIAAWAPTSPDVESWRRRLSGSIAFLAENDSAIVGFIASESDGHLDHLYVHSGFQRQGVGSGLYRRVERELFAGGIHRIFTEASITARPFFESVGFRVIAAQHVERRGCSFTNYRMERFLLESSRDTTG
jgi:GNAT superfamily N-acetyltransferase